MRGRRLRRAAALAYLLLLSVACGGGGGDREVATPAPAPAAGSRSTTSTSVVSTTTTTTTAAPTTTVAPTTVPPAPPTVEQQVEAAYLRSWDVYAEAVRTFDTSRLGQSYALRAFDFLVGEVERLQQVGRRSATSVEHNLRVEITTPVNAVVWDTYTNHSVFVDDAGVPTEPDPNNVVDVAYNLKFLDGSWKVISDVRF